MLKDKKLFLLDMDGTIYIDNQLFPKVKELLEYIKNIDGRYLFITNNSSVSVFDYVKKLNSLGIKTTKEDFYTSSMATSNYINKFYPDKLVYVAGTNSLIDELTKEKIKVTTTLQNNIEVLLLGFDKELTYQKLYDLSYLLSTTDLPYLATNPDKTCPVAFGYIPDCGSMAQMLYNATKKNPYFIGKPNPMMIELAMAYSGYNKEETIIIGDRLHTDILSGVLSNVDTVCVLSGESTLEDIENTNEKPTYVFKDIESFYHILLKNND